MINCSTSPPQLAGVLKRKRKSEDDGKTFFFIYFGSFSRTYYFYFGDPPSISCRQLKKLKLAADEIVQTGIPAASNLSKLEESYKQSEECFFQEIQETVDRYKGSLGEIEQVVSELKSFISAEQMKYSQAMDRVPPGLLQSMIARHYASLKNGTLQAKVLYRNGRRLPAFDNQHMLNLNDKIDLSNQDHRLSFELSVFETFGIPLGIPLGKWRNAVNLFGKAERARGGTIIEESKQGGKKAKKNAKKGGKKTNSEVADEADWEEQMKALDYDQFSASQEDVAEFVKKHFFEFKKSVGRNDCYKLKVPGRKILKRSKSVITPWGPYLQLYWNEETGVGVRFIKNVKKRRMLTFYGDTHIQSKALSEFIAKCKECNNNKKMVKDVATGESFLPCRNHCKVLDLTSGQNNDTTMTWISTDGHLSGYLQHALNKEKATLELKTYKCPVFGVTYGVLVTRQDIVASKEHPVEADWYYGDAFDQAIRNWLNKKVTLIIFYINNALSKYDAITFRI